MCAGMLSRWPCATVLRVPSYLLRVQLEDRPGSLGSLAVALGSVGADILSLDVVERAAGYAIDDLVVDLPPGAMPDMLITAAENLNGVYVDASARTPGCSRRTGSWNSSIMSPRPSGQAKRLQVLADEAPRVLRVGWCTVIRLTDSGPKRIVGSTGAPETQAAETPWLPIDHAEALDDTEDWVPQVWRDMDTTLAAAPLGDHRTAVVLGRPGGPQFRPSEVARLGYLTGIIATILR